MNNKFLTDPNAMAVAWIQSPFIETLLANSSLSEPDEDMVRKYKENGYLITSLDIQDDLMDEVIRSVSNLYEGQGRVQDAWKSFDCVKTIALNPKVLQTLRTLYQKEPVPFQTLNFHVGTQQRAHSDTIHFQSYPHNFMCGVWVALENVDENNGPLFYYPGSHLLPPYDMANLNLRGTRENYPLYEDFLEALILANKFRRETILLKKGQAVIWAANLIHGGSKILDPKRTRHSQVTHYFFEGCGYYTPMVSDVYNGKIAWRGDGLLDIRACKPIAHYYLGERVRSNQMPARSSNEARTFSASKISRAIARALRAWRL